MLAMSKKLKKLRIGNPTPFGRPRATTSTISR